MSDGPGDGAAGGSSGGSGGAAAGRVQVPGYRIGRRIGRGGFAVVHEAEQLSLGRPVALKMLSPERADERELRRFDRERILLAELSRHRHVVDVIDAGTASDGRPFIVMRLYRRGSLAQALADGGPMHPRAVVGIVVKLAGALQAAHNLGVIHRDVKPENVLVADDGEPALADFGISALAGPERTTGNVFTMAHAAPEVLERAEHGVASDVYALASTAYTLLTGHPPFVRENPFAQMQAIVALPVPPMDVPGVPPALEAAVARGLAKKPAQRYPNAVALADALQAALDAPVPPFPAFAPAPTPPPLPSPSSASGAGPASQEPTEALAQAVRGGTAPSPREPRRRGRALLASTAVLLAAAGGLGGTYALGVPPGAYLAERAGLGRAPDLVLATDFSRQAIPDGGDVQRAVDLYLAGRGPVGGRRVTTRPYDIASAARTRWDAQSCRAAARHHVARTDEVAVIGPFNSGCAKELVPVVGADPGTAVTVISNGATDPGLTRAWQPGEPDRYYPGGVRTFARVVATDDVQGRAAAAFAAGDLGVRSVLVLDDGGVYGTHVAAAFAAAARAAGITVVGQRRWTRGAGDYRALFAPTAGTAGPGTPTPGATSSGAATPRAAASGAVARGVAVRGAAVGQVPDAVFLGGAVANDGLEVVRDKVAVLGDNQKVRLLAPDGFAGEPRLAALPQAEGMYVTFPGLTPETVRRRGGAGSAFLDAYQKAYGADPKDPYALYAVAAAQVVLAAVTTSDGTREGVRRRLFSGDGVTVPQQESVLGSDLRIDPATGDVSVKELTIEVVKRGEETFEKVQTVR